MVKQDVRNSIRSRAGILLGFAYFVGVCVIWFAAIYHPRLFRLDGIKEANGRANVISTFFFRFGVRWNAHEANRAVGRTDVRKGSATVTPNPRKKWRRAPRSPPRRWATRSLPPEFGKLIAVSSVRRGVPDAPGSALRDSEGSPFLVFGVSGRVSIRRCRRSMRERGRFRVQYDPPGYQPSPRHER